MDEKKLKQQRDRRAKEENATTKKYERTKGGKLMRSYRNMLSRTAGVQWKKSHLYEGKELLNKQEFYDFSYNSPDFNKLFEQWVDSGYQRKLSPSVDRIDPSKGYVIGNMRWLTHSQNSSLGAINKNKLSQSCGTLFWSGGQT
jgi:hypothetical protein